jgi:hypothetical protein
MSDAKTARMTAISGVAFVVLFLGGFLLFTRSGYPDSGAPAAKIAAYFTQHRDAALTQEFVYGLAFLAGVVFVGGVVTMMWRNAAARSLAVIAGIGGAAATAVGVTATALTMTLAYRPPVGDPGLMRTLLDASFIAFNAGGFALAAFVGAASMAAMQMRVFPRWTGELGLAVAALQLLGAAALSRGDGAFSPQGLVPIVALLALSVWTLCICYAVWRPQEVATAAPTPTPA